MFVNFACRSFHWIATGSKDKKVRIYQISITTSPTGEEPKVVFEKEDHDAEVWRVEWNLTGTMLASSGDDGKTLLWKLNAQSHFEKLTAFTSDVFNSSKN